MPTDKNAYLETERKERIACLFNPATLKLGVANEWRGEKTPGKGPPDLFFAGADSGRFSTELVFDTTDTGKPVTTYTNKLLKLMEVDKSLPDYDAARKIGRPPWVKFHWGDLHTFTAIIERLDISFTYFAANGAPLRARVSLALKQFHDDSQKAPQNPTSGTPSPHKVHWVQPGETLDRISAQHFGVATQWRVIADANQIADPMRIMPGTMLMIPREVPEGGS